MQAASTARQPDRKDLTGPALRTFFRIADAWGLKEQEQYLDTLQEMADRTQAAAQGMAEAFGSVGGAIGAVAAEFARYAADREAATRRIAEAERELVFQPFYRALGTEADGSGLGLAIVREIVERHGGLVSIEDSRPRSPGQTHPGTRFSVRFNAVAAR